MGKVDGCSGHRSGVYARVFKTHWFSRWLAGEADYAQVHQAGRGDPPFQLQDDPAGEPIVRPPAGTEGGPTSTS